MRLVSMFPSFHAFRVIKSSFHFDTERSPGLKLKPGLRESQLQVEWNVAFVYSLVVERRY